MHPSHLMRFHRRSHLAVIATVLATSLPMLASAQYTAVSLHPPGWPDSIGEGIGSATAQVGEVINGAASHPAYWTGTSASFVDLLPAGCDDGFAIGGSSTLQAGYCHPTAAAAGDYHAFVWAGTAASAVDIHANTTAGWPAFTWEYSEITDSDGATHVGYVSDNDTFQDHAAVWTGTSNVPVDLHDASMTSTRVNGFSGNTFVGVGVTPSFHLRAVKWTSASAASFAVVHPVSGFLSSRLRDTDGTIGVGIGVPTAGSMNHAIYWSALNDASATDINPAGFETTEVYGTNGSKHAGRGKSATLTSNNFHALLWTGASSAALDLHQFLPVDYTVSEAYKIDAAGNVIGYAFNNTLGRAEATLWKPNAAVTEWSVY